MWTDRANRAARWNRACGRRRPGPAWSARLPRVSIDVPVLEVLGLADRLRAAADLGPMAAARLPPSGAAGSVTAALEEFLGSFGLAARAVGAEAGSLGDAAEAAARSWVALDEGLLARRGQLVAR